MNYITKISQETITTPKDDYDCGWSLVRMLAGLSLQASAQAPVVARMPAARKPIANAIAGGCNTDARTECRT